MFKKVTYHLSLVMLILCVSVSFAWMLDIPSQIGHHPVLRFDDTISIASNDATVTVEIDQPIGVMQEYDAKQVEANAKLAGFDDIKIDGTTVTFTKPAKGKAVTADDNYTSSATTVTKTTSSTTKGGKTTTTTTTTTQKKRYGKK
jgi:hypothetical protein